MKPTHRQATLEELLALNPSIRLRSQADILSLQIRLSVPRLGGALGQHPPVYT